MTDGEGEVLIKAYDLPFQKTATFKDVTLFGGMKVLRMTFRARLRRGALNVRWMPVLWYMFLPINWAASFAS